MCGVGGGRGGCVGVTCFTCLCLALCPPLSFLPFPFSPPRSLLPPSPSSPPHSLTPPPSHPAPSSPSHSLLPHSQEKPDVKGDEFKVVQSAYRPATRPAPKLGPTPTPSHSVFWPSPEKSEDCPHHREGQQRILPYLLHSSTLLFSVLKLEIVLTQRRRQKRRWLLGRMVVTVLVRRV